MKMALGITIPQLSVSAHNFTEPDPEFDNYLYSPVPSVALPSSTAGTPTSVTTTILQTGAESNLSTTIQSAGNTTIVETAPNEEPSVGQTMLTPHVIKGLISFLSQESTQPLWNYEDITAKGEHSLRIVESSRIIQDFFLFLFSQFGR